MSTSLPVLRAHSDRPIVVVVVVVITGGRRRKITSTAGIPDAGRRAAAGCPLAAARPATTGPLAGRGGAVRAADAVSLSLPSVITVVLRCSRRRRRRQLIRGYDLFSRWWCSCEFATCESYHDEHRISRQQHVLALCFLVVNNVLVLLRLLFLFFFFSFMSFLWTINNRTFSPFSANVNVFPQLWFINPFDLVGISSFVVVTVARPSDRQNMQSGGFTSKMWNALISR